jgi:hypothetical protein
MAGYVVRLHITDAGGSMPRHEHDGSRDNEETGAADLFSQLGEDVGRALRREIDELRAELGERAATAAKGAAMLAGAGASASVACAALLTLPLMALRRSRSWSPPAPDRSAPISPAAVCATSRPPPPWMPSRSSARCAERCAPCPDTRSRVVLDFRKTSGPAEFLVRVAGAGRTAPAGTRNASGASPALGRG